MAGGGGGGGGVRKSMEGGKMSERKGREEGGEGGKGGKEEKKEKYKCHYYKCRYMHNAHYV